MIIKVDSAQTFLEVVPLIQEYVKQPRGFLAVDTETFSLKKGTFPRATKNRDGTINGHMRTLQIGFSPSETLAIRGIQIVIDVQRIGQSLMSGYQMITEYLKDTLETAQIIGQNLKYEFQMLWVHCRIRLRRMMDTFLMSQVLKAGDKVHHGLGDLYARYLDFGWFKVKTGMDFKQYKRFKEDHQKQDWEFVELEGDSLIYTADDVGDLLFALFDALCAAIKEWRDTYEANLPQGKGMREVITRECAAIPVFAMMELRGIKQDEHYLQNILIRYLVERRQEAIDHLGFTRVVKYQRVNRWCLLKTGKESAVVNPKLKVRWEEEVVEPVNISSPQQLKLEINNFLSEALMINGDQFEEDESLEIESTKEDVLFDLLHQNRKRLTKEAIEKLEWILQYKKADSLLSKFGPKMLDLASDRSYLHPEWHQIGTEENAVSSGRSACKKPNMMQMPSRGVLWVREWDKDGKPVFHFDETGFPLQGVSVVEFFRSIFICEEGWILLDADYSQEEPKIASEVCNEENLIRDFQKFGKKADVHSFTGKALGGLDYYPPKGDYYRDFIGKTGGLQLLYGAYWPALRDFMYIETQGRVDWTDEEAEAAFEKYFENFPSFRKAMDRARKQAEAWPEQWGWNLSPCKNNRLPYSAFWTSAWYRKRSFHLDPHRHCKKPDFMLKKGYKAPELDANGNQVLDDNGKPKTTWKNIYRTLISSAGREGFNHQIQGTAADILKEAVVLIEERFTEAGFDWEEGIVALIHDEVLCHVKIEHAEIAKQIMHDSMLEVWNKYFKRVEMYIDVGSGRTWAEAKH